MKVLVTGASGFIGNHLCAKLHADGHCVTALVRPNSDFAHLHEDIVAIEGDISDEQALHRATQNVEVAYHLAAIPNWQGNMSDEDYTRTNVVGTELLLKACVANGVKKFVFTSSLEAVGPSQNGRPVDEQTEPSPQNIYGRSKREAETIVQKIAQDTALETVVVRLPLIYGPGNRLHLKRFFQMTRTGVYPLVGDGSALMEFCYVKNAVHGLMLAAQKGRSGEIYFISDHRSYALREVIVAIAQGLDVKVRFLRMPVAVALGVGLSVELLSKVFRFYPFIFAGTGRPAFSRRSVRWMSQSTLYCDIDKAKEELGYIAPYSLEEGIRENIHWFQTVGAL